MLKLHDGAVLYMYCSHESVIPWAKKSPPHKSKSHHA